MASLRSWPFTVVVLFGAACSGCAVNTPAQVAAVPGFSSGPVSLHGGGGDAPGEAPVAVAAQSSAVFPFFPQGATLWQDLPVLNFVDLDPTSGIQTFDCTARVYDTHNGHDAVIVGFTEQAIGVPVFAALDGTVINRQDGNPDMNTTANGLPSNQVYLDHGNGLTTRYHHLKNGSVAVSLAQVVTAGQQIGLTASSGNSTWPHLHFGAFQDGVRFEPQAGPCRAGASNWVNQVPVPSDMRLTSFTFGTGFFTGNMALPFDQVARKGTFVTGPAAQGVYWRYSFFHLPANAVPTFTMRRPDGTVADTFNGNLNPAAVRSGQHSFGRNVILNVTGTWTLDLVVNGAFVARAPFTVVASAGAVVNRAPLATSVALDPMFPGPTDVPFCRISPWAVHRADPDYDVVRYRYVWRVNGVVVRDVTSAGLGDAIPKGLVQAGNTVTCTVTPNDGVVDGPTSTTSNLADVNLLQNPSFSSSTTGWSLFGTPDQSYMQSQVTNGVFEFYRVAPPAGTANQALVFQETTTSLRTGARVAASFRLGNSSTVRKRISVLLHDSDFADLFVCTFWLPANMPLTQYSMLSHTTKPWNHATISFYAATHTSNGGFYQLDDVNLEFEAAGAVDRTECVDPNAPVPPGGVLGPELIVNGDFATGALPPWTPFGAITAQVAGGVAEFYRQPGTPAGVILQSTGQPSAAGSILTATFSLGNSSFVRKRVTAIVHDLSFGDLHACTFWLPPGQALQTYTVRTYATQAWANTTLSFYPSTVGLEQWTRLDNVSMRSTPAAALLGTGCYEPGAAVPDAGGGAPVGGGVSSLVPGPRVDQEPAWTAVGFGLSGAVDGGTWQVGAASSSLTALEIDDAIDLRGAPGGQVAVESLFIGRGATAAVQVSVDGATWAAIAAVPESTDWTPLEIDLAAYAGRVVYVRFLFDASAIGGPAPDSSWLLRNPRVRVDER